jgi:hypothetical protein
VNIVDRRLAAAGLFDDTDTRLDTIEALDEAIEALDEFIDARLDPIDARVEETDALGEAIDRLLLGSMLWRRLSEGFGGTRSSVVRGCPICIID